jgi:hypothetical protein
MHRDLAPAAHSRAVDSGHRRHQRVFQCGGHLLEAADGFFDITEGARRDLLHQRRQVGAGGEWRFRLPDHQALVAGFGAAHGLDDALDDIRSERAGLALEGKNRHIVAARRSGRPHPHRVRLENRFALRPLFAQHRLREMLTAVDGQRRTRLERIGLGGV